MGTVAECKKQVCDMICLFSSQCTAKLISGSKGGKLCTCVLCALQDVSHVSLLRATSKTWASGEAVMVMVFQQKPLASVSLGIMCLTWQWGSNRWTATLEQGKGQAFLFGIFPLFLTSAFVFLLRPPQLFPPASIFCINVLDIVPLTLLSFHFRELVLVCF